MGVYVGGEECRVIYVARNGQQLRVSSIWVGDQQVFPPADRQQIHAFNRDTQGYGRTDNGTHFGFSVPVPWWATSLDVVLLGAGEKGRDGTKSFTGGSDGAGGKSGAWVVKTVALTQSADAVVRVGKGTSTSPHATEMILPGVGGQADVRVHDGEGTRTANSGSTGGSVTPRSRTEFGTYHYGGPGGSRNFPGNHPGGGGGGGQGSNLLGNPREGQPGGDGYVWLRFRSAPALNPGDDEFILRVGVFSGFAHTPLREWAVGIGKTYQTITEITVPMEVVAPSLQSLFDSCWALTTIPALDTSQVTDMGSMFYGCRALVSVPELDTSQVTDMGSMFFGCWALTTIPALDTSQVTNTFATFYGCSSLESVTLPGMGNAFTTAQTLGMKATKLNAAAANALMQSLGTVPAAANGTKLELPSTAAGADTSIAASKNWTVTISADVLRVGVTSGDAYGPLREWAVGIGKTYLTITEITAPVEVVGPSLQRLFYGCQSLATIPDLDTSKVTNMYSMFYGCSVLASAPDLDTSQVTNMYALFYNCSVLANVPDLDTSQVTDMSFMFYGCSSLTSVPELNTSQVTTMRSMFYDCSSLTTIPALDTSQVTTMYSMFRGCWALTTIPALDTSQVTEMRSMFDTCSSLTTIPALDTSKVTGMYSMFYDCSSLTTIPALNTSKVTNSGFMFANCSSLESVTLPGMGNGFTTGSSETDRTLNMKATKLNTAAANALMQSLGTPPPGGTLQLPSTAAGANTNIAASKNWTVTIG